MAGPRAQWPLVGRDEELALAGGYVTGRPPMSVVIMGSPGVGKTRLAEAAGHAAAAAGMVVLPVLATRAAALVPFGALADLVPDEGPALAPGQLLRRMAASLRGRGEGRPLALVVDDAHLLDAGSAALVLQAAGAGDAAVVATVRAGEPCPDAITALWKDRGALRLDLQPLSEAEVRCLLEAVLPGGMVDSRLIRWVAGRSRGNPLYCRELMLNMVAARRVGQDGGLWRRTGEPVIGPRLAELVQDRLGALDRSERAAMELVVLAEPIGLDLLEQLTGAQVVASLEERQLIAADRSAAPQVRLGHPLYGDVIRQQLGEVRRRQHSRALAEALEGHGEPRGRALLRVATWRLDAEAASPELLTRAAAAAAAMFDHDLTARLAAAALRVDGGMAAALALAAAETRRNRFAAAEAALAPWEGKARTEAEARAYIAERVPVLRWGLGLGEAAAGLLHQALGWLPGRPWQQYLTAWTVELHQDTGRLSDAARLGRALLAEPDLAPETRLLATFGTSIALLFTGQTDRARATADSSFGLAWRLALQLREHAWGTLAAWLAVRVETGTDLTLAGALVHRVRDHALSRDDDELLGLSEITLGRIALARGAPATARRWLAEAALHLGDCDPRYVLGACLAMLARAEALSGRPGPARAALTRAEETYPLMQATHWIYRHEYARARAWVTAAEGHLAQARQTALAAADDCGEFLLTEITFRHDALRLGQPPASLAAPLQQLASRTDAELAHARAAHAAAAAGHDAAALETAARRLAGTGAGLLAAEAQARAAREYARASRPASARLAAARAAQLAAACPGASTPMLHTASTTQPLTPRERHIAQLAAAGLTSDNIAQRLVLSVRTVESHLYHAFVKLGVTSRAELGPLLDDQPGGRR